MLFRRRDTLVWILVLGGFPALLCLVCALGTPAWRPAIQFPLAMTVWCVLGVLILRSRRHPPRDVVLPWIEPMEAGRFPGRPRTPTDGTTVDPGSTMPARTPSRS